MEKVALFLKALKFSRENSMSDICIYFTHYSYRVIIVYKMSLKLQVFYNIAILRHILRS